MAKTFLTPHEQSVMTVLVAADRGLAVADFASLSLAPRVLGRVLTNLVNLGYVRKGKNDGYVPFWIATEHGKLHHDSFVPRPTAERHPRGGGDTREISAHTDPPPQVIFVVEEHHLVDLLRQHFGNDGIEVQRLRQRMKELELVLIDVGGRAEYSHQKLELVRAERDAALELAAQMEQKTGALRDALRHALAEDEHEQ